LRSPDDARLPSDIHDAAIATAALASLPRPLPNATARPVAAAARARTHAPIRNVVLVSHCDFSGNSALHVLAIARELEQRGLAPTVAVPENSESFDEVQPLPFPVVAYDDAIAGRPVFPDGSGADLVYAFTPRELVRRATVELVRRYGCRHVVHLEDNDLLVLAGELGAVDPITLAALPLPVLDRLVRPRQANPLRAARLLELAAGITVIVPRLLELVPVGVPSAIVPAGFDENVLEPRRPRDEVRAELGLDPGDLVIAYTGTVHALTRDDVRGLYEAVQRLRRDGARAVLVKTGAGSEVTAEFPQLGDGLRDLGHVPRVAIPDVLAAADVLVQPGGTGPFNDFRFPAKIPEYLASGRPVVLPRANVGLELRDGEEALLLDRGDPDEIAAAVIRLASDPELRARIGRAGRAFALRRLRWSASVDRLQALFEEIETAGRAATSPRVLEGADLPAEVIAIVPALPGAAEQEQARLAGIAALCVAPADALAGRGEAADVEALPPPAAPYEQVVYDRLAEPLPGRAWYRLLVPPAEAGALPLYSAWLRKLVLQTALRAPLQAPFLFIDALRVWDSPARTAWLEATRAGVADGIRQFYASQGLAISPGEAELIIRSS
jgi:glycosyltransferase involved in cell wall biosynthesis